MVTIKVEKCYLALGLVVDCIAGEGLLGASGMCPGSVECEIVGGEFVRCGSIEEGDDEVGGGIVAAQL